MTDLEKTVAFLKEMKITYNSAVYNENRLKQITITENQNDVEWNGYSGNVFIFNFDKNEKLIGVGAGEE